MDLHGTVFASDRNIAIQAWEQLSLKQKFKYTPKFLGKVIKYGCHKLSAKPTPGIEHYLLGHPSKPKYAELVTKTISCFKPIPGILALLQKLNHAGIKVLAFSNIGPHSYDYLMAQYPEISAQFTGRIIQEIAQTPNKSQAAAYQRCIAEVTKQLGYTPKKIVFFDDSPAKLQLAQCTDPRFVPIICQSKTPADITKSRATLLKACNLTA